jgi:hypothetical protein
MLANVDNDIIKLLSEMSLNTLRGNVPLKSSQWRALRKYKQILRYLMDRTTPLHQKRSFLSKQQRGGFLPLLIPIIASAVGGVLNNL